MKTNKDNAFANAVLYNATPELRNDSAKAGHYLLVNGMLSAKPFNHLETGIMITDTLYLSFGFSSELCTKDQAREFYKRTLRRKMPTYYQSLLFFQVVPKINRALTELGMEKDTFPMTPDCIWNEHNFQTAGPDDKHRCVMIRATQPFNEIKCDPVADDLLIVNKSLLIQQHNLAFDQTILTLVARCGGLDFLLARTWYTSHLLYRDCRRKLHYLGPKREIKFLNNELVVIGDVLYQIYRSKLFGIRKFDVRSSFAGYEEDMPVIRETDKKDPTKKMYFYYKKNICNIFELHHSDTE